MHRLALLAILAVGVAAGCSGGGSPGARTAGRTEPASTPAGLNASEFRHQVSAICESGDALIEARVTQALESGATAEVASAVLIDTVIPTVENEIAQAEALHGPEELEHGVRTMTASVRVQLDRLREIAASPDPLAGFVGDPFAEAHALAAQLGFAGCRYAER